MIREDFLAVEEELKLRYIDRDEEIHGLLLAALSRHHIVLLGPPGNAKSMLIKDFSEYLEAKHFSWLMTKFTSPDEILGPTKISALKMDMFTRNTSNKLPEAEIAYLDEVFKGNSAILNSLLTILQERTFNNNGGSAECPLIFCVGASNELPDEEEGLSALYDRFLLRYNPGYITDRTSFDRLMLLKHEEKKVPPIPRENLSLAQSEIANMVMSDEALESLGLMWEKLCEAGMMISDRRYKQMHLVMAADSWLRGEIQVTADSLVVGDNILWERPDQRQKIMQIIRMCMDATKEMVGRILEAASEAVSQLKGGYIETNELVQVVTQLRRLNQELNQLKATKAVEQAREKLGNHIKELTTRMITDAAEPRESPAVIGEASPVEATHSASSPNLRFSR